jgi:predicted SAM-dependent methyltransferase
VAADRWTAFVECARRARAKPRFDLEEREYRLGVADAVRALIDAGSNGRRLRDRVAAVVERVTETQFPVIPYGQLQRLVEWAERDEQSFARALRGFTAAGDEPDIRFERFVDAIERGPGAYRFVGGGLVVASLLNFGVSPERFPIVHPGRYRRLQDALGDDDTQSRSMVSEYRRLVAFADRVDTALRDAGVPVRDMLDVESLMTICAIEHERWAPRTNVADSAESIEVLPIVELDVAFPLSRALVEELGMRGFQSGSGTSLRRGWLNSDFQSLQDGNGRRTKPQRLYQVGEDRYFIQHTAPEPYPIESESFQWAFSEHFIEHLRPEDGIAWLAEMRRLLVAGGLVRVVAPDLRKYAQGYSDPSDPFMAEHRRELEAHFPDPEPLKRPAFIVNEIFYGWGHRWMYDFEELRHAASAAGFAFNAVTEQAFRQGRVAELAGLDRPAVALCSLYVEIEKS